MPRRARLALGGIPWHIIQRGNNRSACFYADCDYYFYLNTLFDQAQSHNCLVHAYCLMTNHVHLLITPRDKGGPGLLMKHLGQRYVQYINRSYRRSGTLWEGRYKSSLIQADRYTLACYRYIELNPVRAGIVAHPGEYRWSSYDTNGQGRGVSGITFHDVYLRLGNSDISRQLRYRSLFKSELPSSLVDQIRIATNGNYALGNQRFAEELEAALMRRVVPGKSGRPKKVG